MLDNEERAEALQEYLEPFIQDMEKTDFDTHGERLFGKAEHFYTMGEVLYIMAEMDVGAKKFMSNFTAALLVAFEMGRRSLLQ